VYAPRSVNPISTGASAACKASGRSPSSEMITTLGVSGTVVAVGVILGTAVSVAVLATVVAVFASVPVAALGAVVAVVVVAAEFGAGAWNAEGIAA